MAVKVAINGFGRIGRLAFRQMFGAEGYEVVAINDLTSPKMLAHLLKYDTAQGGYAGRIGEGKHTVEAHDGEGEDNYIVVDGKKIVIYKMPNAADLPWGKIGVDALITIPNDKLIALVGKASLPDALRVADDVLRQGIQGISDLIAVPSMINLDFADVTFAASAAVAMSTNGTQSTISHSSSKAQRAGYSRTLHRFSP